jgi:hypothetical protein
MAGTRVEGKKKTSTILIPNEKEYPNGLKS